MVEKGVSNSAGTVHPLIKKVLASRPPIAELIGFSVEEISDGRAVGSLESGPQPANPMGTVLRPVGQARLWAEAGVVNRGKNVGYVECEVTDENGKQIAKASSTCFLLRGEHAKAR